MRHWGFYNKWLLSHHRKNKTKIMEPNICHLNIYISSPHCEGVKLFIFHSVSCTLSLSPPFSLFTFYLLPVISFPQPWQILQPYLFRFERLFQPSDCDSFVFLQFEIIATLNPQGRTPKKVKRFCPLEPLEGSPALTDKDVHSKSNICRGESKRRCGESRPQRQHVGRLQEFFSPLQRLYRIYI